MQRRRRRTGGRRRLTGTSTALTPYGSRAFTRSSLATAIGAGSRLNQAAELAQVAHLYGSHLAKISKGLKGKIPTKSLSQTTGRRRGRPKGSKNKPKPTNPKRHEKLKMAQGTKMNRGKGFNRSALGTIVTHPNSVIPKWKRDRLYKYKYDVWQTVLISKSSRLAASNNTLQTARYPIQMADTLNSERTQTIVFTPFCSHLSGIHTTLFRKVNAAGTALEHDTTNRLDVIQNKANAERWQGNTSMIEANDGLQIRYPGLNYTAAEVAAESNNKNILRRIDQLVKEVHLDLVFTSSRAFPVKVSVSMVRAIKPQTPYTLSTDNIREMCNGISNHGMDWNTWKTEYHHEFVLQPLRINKKIPTYSVNKTLKTNFIQTNSFNENTTSQDMTQAAQTGLGMNIHSHIDEIADGNQSGNFYILIKYRKIQAPQQFTYKQTIATHSNNTAHASIELPALSQESFDIPTLGTTGNATTSVIAGVSDGATATRGLPFQSNQSDESKANFYLNGKIKYKYGFKHECESIPSVMDMDDADSNYKKPLSLMIDPTYDYTNTTYGIYQQSPDHVNIAENTANTGI